MKKFLVLSVALLSFSATAQVEADIDYIQLKSSSNTRSLLIAESVGFATVDITVQPLALKSGDGKGLMVTDSSGQVLIFSLDDGYSASIWDNGVVAHTNAFNLKAGEKYRFVVHVNEGEVVANYISSEGVEKLFSYEKKLVKPINYKLITQRTGAEFHNVKVVSK